MHPDLEEQLVLRLPPEFALRMRSMIRSGKADQNIEFVMNEDGRTGKFVFGNEEKHLSLLDLPCILESQKTLNTSTYFKSADIGQMIVVHDEEGLPPGANDEYQSKHGITPPTRNIRTRSYKKKPIIPLKDAEQELLKMVRRSAMMAGEVLEMIDGEEDEQLEEINASDEETEQKTKKKRKKSKGSKESKDGEPKKERKRKPRKKKSAEPNGDTVPESLSSPNIASPAPPTPTPMTTPIPMTPTPTPTPTPRQQVQPTPFASMPSFGSPVPAPMPSPMPVRTNMPVPSVIPLPHSLSSPAPQRVVVPPPHAPAPVPVPVKSKSVYEMDPRYLQLLENERRAQAEVATAKRAFDEAANKAKSAAANPIIKARYEAQANQLQSQLQGKTAALDAVKEQQKSLIAAFSS